MRDNLRVSVIVEGQGDVKAAPHLLRRILQERLSRYDIVIQKPKFAGGRTNLTKKLYQYLQYAVMDGCHAIMVIVDADRCCPRQLANYLADSVVDWNRSVPLAIVCPNPEYEVWIIASLSDQYGQKIRERLYIDESINAPEDIEALHNAKGWFKKQMPNHRAYKPTQDQETLTHHISLDLAHRRSRSFRRLCHAVEELVEAMDEGKAGLITPSVS